MNNQSLFVKIIIWFMVFLMSVGFAALVIAPFAGSSLFGGGGGREATEKLVAEARADIERDGCAEEGAELSGAKLDRCKDALKQLASAYTTLARPDQTVAGEEVEVPRDAQRNLERAGDAFRQLYEIDQADEDSAALYAGYLRDSGDTEAALEIWNKLVKDNPQDEDYLLQKAGSHTQLNELDEAIKAYQLYVKRFPDAGQVEQVKEEIENLREQQAQQAAGGGAPGGAGGVPITVG